MYKSYKIFNNTIYFENIAELFEQRQSIESINLNIELLSLTLIDDYSCYVFNLTLA